MTRDQAERLIERLADKTLSKGCIVEMDGLYEVTIPPNPAGHCIAHLISDYRESLLFKEDELPKGWEVLGHPIMLTDVLEKMVMVDYDRLRLVMLWEDCGVTTSLQEVLGETEWHNAPRKAPEGYVTLADMPEQMKGPAKDLFEYLIQLFPERVSTKCTHPTKSPAKDAGEGETNYFICDDCKKPC